MYRNYTCNEINKRYIGKYIYLSGWIYKIRNFGKKIFVDLQDQYSIIQLIFIDNKLINSIKKINIGTVINVYGKIRKRTNINKNIKTGNIEILVNKFRILNYSLPLPFDFKNNNSNNNIMIMKYRYLYLRNLNLKKNFIIKSYICKEIRKFFLNLNFIEIDTPILSKLSLNEGANNYLVPYKNNRFYALSQSPQIYKQLLMISQIDKYFQISKCFRNEDLRKNRQPEFTQIDCEMSFINIKDIFKIIENLLHKLFRKFSFSHVITPFTYISYNEMKYIYNIDKPKIKYGIQIINLKNNIINKIFDNNSKIKIIYLHIPIKFYSSFTKEKIKEYILYIIKKFKLISIFYDNIKKIFSYNLKTLINKKLLSLFKIKNKNIVIFFIYEKFNFNNIKKIIFNIKKNIINIIKKNFSKYIISPIWIYNYPLVKLDIKNNKLSSFHHPFSIPNKKFLPISKYNVLSSTAKSYDLIINGEEIGSGSIRIHNYEIQKKIFKILGYSDIDINNQFGFFINALKYGTPPHGGIALGLERLLSIIYNKNIKDFIAFPKNNKGIDMTTNSPSKYDIII